MSIPHLEWTRPLWLAVALPIAAVLFYFFARSLSDFPRSQRIGSLVIRSLIALLLVAALAGLTLLHPTQDQFVIFVADQSLSVGTEAEAKVCEFLKSVDEAKGGNSVAYLPFAATVGQVQEAAIVYGDNPSLLAKVQPSTPYENTATSSTEWKGAQSKAAEAITKAARDGTNIAKAIETAAGFIPTGYVPKIVLLSDGNETEGNALAMAARCKIPISAIPLPARTEPEVQVSEVIVPADDPIQS
jgi:Ca-activated chloride channel homolog